MEAAWGKDDDAAIKALEENMILDPGFRDTRPKLYSLLIGKADRMLNGGDRDGAFPVLMRALDVLPDAGEAQRRLASYTPTPVPVPPPPPPAPAAATTAATSRRRSRSRPSLNISRRHRRHRGPARDGPIQAGRVAGLGFRSNRLALGALDS